LTSWKVDRYTNEVIWFLKVLAPIIAILIGWCWLENAWIAILGYHGQICLWMIVGKDEYRIGRVDKSWVLILPLACSGVIAYFLLPLLIRVDLTDWLGDYGLGNRSFYLMVIYFGLVHPFLEQRHWRPLCNEKVFGHVIFAGYHVLVLMSLLTVPMVILAFFVLLGASLFWSWLYLREGSGLAATITHIFADFGMILAVLLLIMNFE